MLGQANGKTKVTQVDLQVVINHDVLRLDVSMNNLARVARLQSSEDLSEHFLAGGFIEVTFDRVSHLTVQVTSRYVWQYHDNLIFPHYQLL